MQKYNKPIIYVIAGLIAAVVLVGFLIPVRIEADIDPDKLSKYEELTRDDVNVYLSPLFRRGKQVDDFSFKKDTSGNYEDIIIQHTIYYKKEHIRNTLLEKIEAIYEGSPHEGDAFKREQVKVTAYYKDGTQEAISDFNVLNAEKTLTVNSDMIIKTALGSAKLEIPFQQLSDMEAVYTTSAYEGDKFNPEYVSVSMKYTDGGEIAVDNFDYEGKSVIRGKTDYTIFTSYGKTTLTVEPIPVNYATSHDTYYEGDAFNGKIALVYADGTEKEINTSDVVFEEEPILSFGLNKIPFKWKKTNYTLYVNANEATMVSGAANALKEEVDNSIYNEVNNNVFLTVQRVNDDYGYVYYLTHVVLSNPDQISVATAKNKYNSGLETPMAAAKRTGWLLGINGSFFDTSDARPVYDACMIRDGKIIYDGETSGYEVCITKDGALYSPPEGVSAQSLLDAGVKDILKTTDPLLIQEGLLYNEGNTEIGEDFPRTAIGMVKPGEYYFLTSDAGITYSRMQDVFSGLGCQFARSLDGGNSTALMFREQVVNNSAGRGVADFLQIQAKT